MDERRGYRDERHDPATRHLGERPTYEFSQEEIQAFKQCQRESFLQRSLPMAVGFGTLTYYAVQTGLLKAHPKYGKIPKVIGSSFLGYALGQFSIFSKCMDHVVATFPDGGIAQARSTRRYPERHTFEQSNLPRVDKSPGNRDRHSHLDVDSARPLDLNDGLTDIGRPSLDDPVYEEEEIPLPATAPRTTSYEELRRRNREEYESVVRKPAPAPRLGGYTAESRPVYGSDPHRPNPQPSQASPTPTNTPNPKRNKYGDIME